MSATKGVPLAKDEVALLIDLVEANKAITSKATNATNNQLKEVAWATITDAFNASISSCARRSDQLKLKWENLKKCARKRFTKIRMNQIKTGGGKPDYIPPDDALDRVASILGATCEGYSVSLGGDAEVTVDAKVLSDGGGVMVIDCGMGDGDSKLSVDNESGSSGSNQPLPKKCFFYTPSGNNINKQKRRLLDEDVRARTARNKAIADYYIIKRKKLELEIENIELTNKKIKLDLEQNKRAAGGTGGGPALKLVLTDQDKRVLNIIGPQAATGLISEKEVGL